MNPHPRQYVYSWKVTNWSKLDTKAPEFSPSFKASGSTWNLLLTKRPISQSFSLYLVLQPKKKKKTIPKLSREKIKLSDLTKNSHNITRTNPPTGYKSTPHNVPSLPQIVDMSFHIIPQIHLENLVHGKEDFLSDNDIKECLYNDSLLISLKFRIIPKINIYGIPPSNKSLESCLPLPDEKNHNISSEIHLAFDSDQNKEPYTHQRPDFKPGIQTNLLNHHPHPKSLVSLSGHSKKHCCPVQPNVQKNKSSFKNLESDHKNNLESFKDSPTASQSTFFKSSTPNMPKSPNVTKNQKNQVASKENIINHAYESPINKPKSNPYSESPATDSKKDHQYPLNTCNDLDQNENWGKIKSVSYCVLVPKSSRFFGVPYDAFICINDPSISNKLISSLNENSEVLQKKPHHQKNLLKPKETTEKINIKFNDLNSKNENDTKHPITSPEYRKLAKHHKASSESLLSCPKVPGNKKTNGKLGNTGRRLPEVDKSLHEKSAIQASKHYCPSQKERIEYGFISLVYIWVHKEAIQEFSILLGSLIKQNAAHGFNGAYLTVPPHYPPAILRILEYIYYGNCFDLGVTPINLDINFIKALHENSHNCRQEKQSTNTLSKRSNQNPSLLSEAVLSRKIIDMNYELVVLEVAQTLKLSRYYSVKALENICWTILKSFINTSFTSLWAIWTYSEECSCNDVSKFCLEYSIFNSLKAMESPGFLITSEKCIQRFFSSDLHSVPERDLFLGLLKWAEFDPKNWIIGKNEPDSVWLKPIFGNIDHIYYNSKHIQMFDREYRECKPNELQYSTNHHFETPNQMTTLDHQNNSIQLEKYPRILSLENLLPLFNFNLFEKDFLLNVVETNKLVTSTNIGWKLLAGAFKFHAFGNKIGTHQKHARNSQIPSNLDKNSQKIRFYTKSDFSHHNQNEQNFKIVLGGNYQKT
ncbi:hypothetical protein AYI68_g2670 [Smittium mucronatum]|uniref:MATH domain-containing protein n=1 Tax=Smittium mucronatum TaxID=133383 RepID=A0A1R0H235_9FUNG|nr:hypothetical protein AYI68_g2670 [Smittium mucronatum]